MRFSSVAAGGGTTLTAIKNDKRTALATLLRQLASYAHGNLTVLLSSGFPIQKPQSNPVGVLPAPAYVTVSFGARTGELAAGVAPVPGAAIYNWQLAAASAPTAVLQTAQTTAASNSFAGLTPGVTYTVQVNAVGSAGPIDWSEPVSQMVV